MIHIYTGNGKGKTTAALGLATRTLGNGGKVCLIQFMKGNRTYSEIRFFSKLQNIDIYQYGTNKFVDPDHPEPIDIKEAQKARDKSYDAILSHTYDLIILDEINNAVRSKLISLKDQLKIFEISGSTEVIMTGRNAADIVMKKADLVTEMKEIKHYYSQGISARKGIEF